MHAEWDSMLAMHAGSRRPVRSWARFLAPVVLLTMIIEPRSSRATGARWAATGAMIGARYAHAAVLLPNRTVLVVGGLDAHGHPLASAEVYNPRTGRWTQTGSMSAARANFTLTLLSNGKVLAVGGCPDSAACNSPLTSTELYDPRTGTWRATGNMHDARSHHTATLLPSGKVLVAGGCCGEMVCDGGQCRGPLLLSSAELYDVRTGIWTATRSMLAPRGDATATLLRDGRVLVAGGDGPLGYAGQGSAELYNPRARTWSRAGTMTVGRAVHTATLLSNGQILVTGGVDVGGLGSPSAVAARSAELYNPRTGTWTATGSLNRGRSDATATLLRRGQVLVTGGVDSVNGVAILSSAELYDGRTGKWLRAPSMRVPREQSTATLLPDGRVLASGGYSVKGITSSAEVYAPDMAKVLPHLSKEPG